MSQNQNQSNQETKVVALFAKKQERPLDATESASKADSSALQSKDEGIADAMRKNMENAERMRRERLKANQGVLKSYKIKN